MLVVSGLIEVHADDRAAAEAAAQKMAAATIKEAGCISYEFSECLGRPGLYRVFEEWIDQDCLAAHFETPHMASFAKALSRIRLLSRDIKRYHVESSEPL